MMAERNYQFDNMKAFLIFLVVFAHVINSFSRDCPAGDILYKTIFSFHMPAFLFISGYFAKCDPKKILSRIFPLYAVFQLFRFFLDFVLDSIQAGHPVAVDIQFFTPRWTLWYLFAMIIYQLLLPVFDTQNKNHRIAYIILAMVLGIVIGYNPDTENFMAMSRIMNFLPFFLAGYYEKDGHLFERLGKQKFPRAAKWVSAILAVCLVLTFIHIHEDSKAKLFWGTESFDGAFFTWYTRAIAWIIAFVWIWILIVWFPDKQLPMIETIGRNTLSVYLLHSIVLVILMASAKASGFLENRIGLAVLLSAGLTFVLSRTCFDRMLRKIAIPYQFQR